MPRHTDTIAALATPAGTAALAMLRVSGPESARLAREIFGVAPPPRRVRHGDYRDRGGAMLDDVMFTFFAGPKSYTGEDSLEISSHGNPFIAQKILEDLLARGCQAAEPGEFTQRAFLNGRMDLSQAEAVMDVIHARSERALAAANQQLRGALGRRMEALTGRLLGVLAHVEAYIDFPDEDLPPEDQGRLSGEIDLLIAETAQLMATSHYGAMLRDGIKTVILGAPNAGKSSLLNRLVGHERAIVSAEPGTTRDFIEERVMLGPHCLRLIDTAGLNPQPGAIEQLGIERTLAQAAEADLILLVVQTGSPRPTLPAALEKRLGICKVLLVMSKSDLGCKGRTAVTTSSGELKMVSTSALTGEGITQLVSELMSMADTFQVAVGDDLIAINARHASALERATDGFMAARQKIYGQGAGELIASDLRGSLMAFGEISGKIDNEQMLDQLFHSFCIGK